MSSPSDFIPHEPTLADIVQGDTINYGGKTDTVANVGSVTNHGDGTITVSVTLTTSGVTLTLRTADTICSSFGISADGTRHAVWSQSAQA